jgi:hypothetical protein
MWNRIQAMGGNSREGDYNVYWSRQNVVEVVNNAVKPVVVPPNQSDQPINITVAAGILSNPNSSVVKQLTKVVKQPLEVVKRSSHVVNQSLQVVRFDRRLTKNLDAFVTELLKTEISYEKLVEATEKFRGKPSKSLLDAVTNLILDMQKLECLRNSSPRRHKTVTNRHLHRSVVIGAIKQLMEAWKRAGRSWNCP